MGAATGALGKAVDSGIEESQFRRVPRCMWWLMETGRADEHAVTTSPLPLRCPILGESVTSPSMATAGTAKPQIQVPAD